jgi:NADPH:quinone reductase-like Zn-dependent oxidoreductase
MKAWQVSRHGEPEDVLELAEVPWPVPGPGQLLVRVLAAAANFPDALLCRVPLTHPDVRDAAVVGMPYADGGEAPKAFAVTGLRPSSE